MDAMHDYDRGWIDGVEAAARSLERTPWRLATKHIRHAVLKGKLAPPERTDFSKLTTSQMLDRLGVMMREMKKHGLLR